MAEPTRIGVAESQSDVQDTKREHRRSLVLMWLRNQNESERNFNVYEQTSSGKNQHWSEVAQALFFRLHQQEAVFAELKEILNIPTERTLDVKVTIQELQDEMAQLREQVNPLQSADAVAIHQRYSALYDKLFGILKICGMSDEDWFAVLQESVQTYGAVLPIDGDEELTGDTDTWDPDKP